MGSFVILFFLSLRRFPWLLTIEPSLWFNHPCVLTFLLVYFVLVSCLAYLVFFRFSHFAPFLSLLLFMALVSLSLCFFSRSSSTPQSARLIVLCFSIEQYIIPDMATLTPKFSSLFLNRRRGSNSNKTNNNNKKNTDDEEREISFRSVSSGPR